MRDWKHVEVGLSKRSVKCLHIETPLGIVNIRTGLTDSEGRRVDSIEILPDRIPTEGVYVAIDGHINNRLVLGGETRP